MKFLRKMILTIDTRERRRTSFLSASTRFIACMSSHEHSQSLASYWSYVSVWCRHVRSGTGRRQEGVQILSEASQRGPTVHPRGAQPRLPAHCEPGSVHRVSRGRVQSQLAAGNNNNNNNNNNNKHACAGQLNSFTRLRDLLVLHDRGILAHATSVTGQFTSN